LAVLNLLALRTRTFLAQPSMGHTSQHLPPFLPFVVYL
jgi:hypothetical protein